MENDVLLIVVTNFMACTMGGFVTMCRMTKMTAASTKLAIRWQYVMWYCAFAASGWSFAFGAPATEPQLIVSLLLLSGLLLGTAAWTNGAPAHTFKQPC